MIRMRYLKRDLSHLLELKTKIFDNEIQSHEHSDYLQCVSYANHEWHEKSQLLQETVEKLIEYN